jgi:chemotaxis family two-component system sensor kinase Cph1
MSSVPSSSEQDLRVLVLAPRGRDARVICEVLQRAGVRAESCATVEDLGQQLQVGAGAAVLTAGVLTVSRIQVLVKVLDRQPAWSALPFLLLTGGGASTRTSMRQLALLEQLQTITLLERPLRKVTLVSAVQGLLRLRLRQYEIRDYLAERQQRAAQLQQANAELRQFAYVASHDLQEPLRMVTSYMQLLTQRYHDQLDAQAQEFIGYAVEGAQRMHELISDLLAYSRVETQETEWTETDGEAVLEQALRDLQLTVAESGAVVTHDPLPTVTAVRGQLRQLLENLLSNALKFRGSEPPRIHLSAQRQGTEWVFSVRDNGIGLDPKQAERIFQMFQRLHTRKEYPGTGIGLALCKKIVERHRGRIWVESEPGQGAIFFFTLPVPEKKRAP